MALFFLWGLVDHRPRAGPAATSNNYGVAKQVIGRERGRILLRACAERNRGSLSSLSVRPTSGLWVPFSLSGLGGGHHHLTASSCPAASARAGRLWAGRGGK